MTIALLSRRVYDDLRHLGAPNRYLFRSVKGQVSRVFLVPAIVGTGVISAFSSALQSCSSTTAASLPARSPAWAPAPRVVAGAVPGALDERLPRHPRERLPQSGAPPGVKIKQCRLPLPADKTAAFPPGAEARKKEARSKSSVPLSFRSFGSHTPVQNRYEHSPRTARGWRCRWDSGCRRWCR